MLVIVPEVLNKDQLKKIRDLLQNADYVDGRLSAGKTARKVKKNHELATDSKLHGQLNNIVMNSLYNHPTYQAAVLPHRLATPFYARYEPGETYGQHVDDPIMGPMQGRYRTDVSTTIFLNEPEDYDGGEVVIESATGEKFFQIGRWFCNHLPFRGIASRSRNNSWYASGSSYMGSEFNS